MLWKGRPGGNASAADSLLTTRVADEPPLPFLLPSGPINGGIRREAYYAGWALVSHLLENGWTLPGLARVPRGLMSRVVDRGLRELLEGDE
jgi:hypothetical protein